MNFQKHNSALLPAGFEDLLPPYAEEESRVISNLLGTFKAHGYERVKPPIAEFEETMLGLGASAALAGQTFRVMDPASHKMMALRSDITAQIARIARTRLAQEPRPLRVTYANDVIRTKAAQQRTVRQFTQVGCEMVGADCVASDIEVVLVAIRALTALDSKGLTIDFALPQIFDAVFEAAGRDREEIDVLRSRMAGPAGSSLEALKGMGFGSEERAKIERLEAVISGVSEALAELGIDDVQLTLDPLENKGFEYHSGVVFTLFAKDVRGELGRGGRYEIYEDDRQAESAAGFTLYMDTIRQGVSVGAPHKRIFVENAAWSDIQTLQEAGWVTLLDGPLEKCTHIYKDGTIKEL